MSLGGVAIGLAFAMALVTVLYFLDLRLERDYDVLQAVAVLSIAYISYYVADTVLEMSGIVACVTCGIVSAAWGRGLINDTEMMDTYLSLMEHLLNTLLFALGGVQWGKIVSERKNSPISIDRHDWGWLFAFYFLVELIRFVQVFLFYPILKRIGLKTNWKEAVFLSYGGLR